jgi:5S rRNA maturation endonuclease (ribonuclease M5)
MLRDDAGDWLVVPRIAPTPVLRSAAAHDDLGPHTGKWDCVGADGQLLACVYRHDTPTGKQYRPWDARARAMRVPEPRPPLYNLPAVAASDAVVLVEGETGADALMQLGIVATTAMGGASTAIDKSDWTPLAGKTVAVWPDHDEAGARYADTVIPKLMYIGAEVRRVTVPPNTRKKWDAADAVAEGASRRSLSKQRVSIGNAHHPRV